tara:strand:+ start:2188 stop:2838 length:651 start_codon:yes stop_codon:yes gene_type:complete
MSYLFKKGLGYVHSLFSKNGEKQTKHLLAKGDVRAYDAMKNSYASQSDQAKFGAEQGYIYDDVLSTDNSQVYYNPESGKMLYSITGTHNVSDIGTDFQLMRGRLNDTKRFKQAEDTFTLAKQKYQPKETVAYGTSLGGGIAAQLDADRIVTLNKANAIGAKTGKREVAIRTHGDIVSVFGANAKHMNTIGGGDLYNPMTWLNSHGSHNLKGKDLFI